MPDRVLTQEEQDAIRAEFDRLVAENATLRARVKGLEEGTKTLQHCPRCGVHRRDAPAPPAPESGWTNPPHNYQCHYCSTIWRPTDVGPKGRADTGTPDMPVLRALLRTLTATAGAYVGNAGMTDKNLAALHAALRGASAALRAETAETAENARLREALLMIAEGHTSIPGLRPHFYGHAMKIAAVALGVPEKAWHPTVDVRAALAADPAPGGSS